MVQGDFHAAIGTKSVRLSGGQFRFVIQALDGAGGNLAVRAKPVEDQGPVPTQHPRDLLDGIEAGAHDLGTPAVEELAGPHGGAVGPEGLEVLAQQGGAHRLEIMADEGAQATPFFRGAMVASFEQQPAGLGEERLSPLAAEVVDLGPAYRLNGLTHVHRDVEAVEDVQRVAGLLGHDLEVRLPHVAAHEAERLRALVAEPAEEPCLLYTSPSPRD